MHVIDSKRSNDCRLDPEQPDFKIPPGQSLSCLIAGKSWQVSRTDSMPNWFVAAEGMDPVVIDNTVSEDLSYVSRFDTSNKWKRYPDDQYNPYSPPTRFGIFKDIADRGRAVKPVIPSPKNLKMNPNRQVRIGGQNNRWFILRNGRFQAAGKDLTGLFYNFSRFHYIPPKLLHYKNTKRTFIPIILYFYEQL